MSQVKKLKEQVQELKEELRLLDEERSSQYENKPIGMFAVTSQLGLVGREATTVIPL